MEDLGEQASPRQGHHVTLSSTRLRLPFPKRSSRPRRAAPRRSPSRASGGRSRRSQRFQPRALTGSGLPGVLCAMAPAQSHGRRVLQEPRQHPQGLVQRAGSRLPLKPANSQLLRLGRLCIHVKAAENIFREAVLIWGPRRPLLANSGPCSRGSSRAARLPGPGEARAERGPSARLRGLSASFRPGGAAGSAGPGSGGGRRCRSPVPCWRNPGSEHVWTQRRA